MLAFATLFAPVALLATGCNSSSSSLSTSGDSGPASASFGLDWSLSEVVPTVPTVSWSADEIVAAWVVFGRDGSWEHRVAVDLSGGPPYSTTVLGMKPDSSYALRVEAQAADSAQLLSEQVEVQTGFASTDLPAVELSLPDPDRATGGFYVTGQVTPPVALILDDEGDVVWWYRLVSIDMMGRVLLSMDGDSVLMGPINLEGDEEGELLRVSLDGTQEQHISTPWRHHDFVEHADGTIAYLAHDPRDSDEGVVLGDRVVELAPDGTTSDIYSVWDHHEAGAGSGGTGGPGGGTSGGGNGWPHANALDWLPDQQAYLVSFLHLGGIAKVDRATGEELWFLGGSESTLHDAEGQADWFEGQHGMEDLGDGLLVFVNGQGASGSHVVELALDPQAGSAEERWSYWPEPSLGSPVLGDVHRYESGNTLVTFSYNGEVQEIDADGAVLWSLSADLGGALSYMTWLPRLQAE